MQRLAQASCQLIRDPIRNSDSFHGWPNNRTKYTYDANGNQLSSTGTVALTETVSTHNNQLSATSGAFARTYAYDSAGNISRYTGTTGQFAYNDRGRMRTSSLGLCSGGPNTNYTYNALGQLIEKVGNCPTILLMYDEAGHLLGEYSNTGVLIQETVWMGDMPVATLQPNGSSITAYYVHTDHLGTPRKITNPSTNAVVWRWDPDTFGSVGPSITTITYNLRFPGMYYLPESGHFYNYFRDYDPQTGRYLESDPIGLHGGSYSTYGYVGANPLSFTDRFGLAIGDFPPLPPGYNPASWSTGQYGNTSRWFLQDPNGNRYIAHPEDWGHWRHWDKQDKDGNDDGGCPSNNKKPWPGQKRGLKPNQSASDPSGDAPPWTPPNSDYFVIPNGDLPVVGWPFELNIAPSMPIGPAIRLPAPAYP